MILSDSALLHQSRLAFSHVHAFARKDRPHQFCASKLPSEALRSRRLVMTVSISLRAFCNSAWTRHAADGNQQCRVSQQHANIDPEALYFNKYSQNGPRIS